LTLKFQAQKQRENELIEQSAQIKQQLHPELAPEAFVKYNEKGEAQETPVSEVKYIQDAISVLPAMEQDQRMAKRAIDIQKQYEGEFKEISKFGNIPLVSTAANAAVAVGSGLTSMLADVAQFITEPFAATQRRRIRRSNSRGCRSNL